MKLTRVVDCPAQMVCVGGMTVRTGNGLTVTTYSTGVPVHPFACGVMVYVAVPLLVDPAGKERLSLI